MIEYNFEKSHDSLFFRAIFLYQFQNFNIHRLQPIAK